jgi:spermidine/putrescine transport system permease protein
MKFPALKAYTIAYLIFLYAPIALVPIFAFNNSQIMAFPLSGFTTSWFGNMWANAELFHSLKNSMIVSITTSVMATTFGIFAARALTRYRFPGKGPSAGLILLPMVLPDMVMAMSMLVVFLAIGIPLTIFTIILGHVLICTPFAVAILQSAFQSLDQSLEEAAQDLGEGPLSTFWRVILPLVMPGIISSALICFTISIDEFVFSYFLGGTETTLSVFIFSQFRFPAQVPAVMALGTILIGLSIILLTTAEYFRRRGIARTGGKDTGGFL